MMTKKCPQCKNLISINSPTCLYCGRPNKFVTNDYVNRKWDRNYKNNKINISKVLISKKTLFLVIFALLIIIVSLYL